MMSVDLAQLYKANDKKRVYIRTDKNGTKEDIVYEVS